jgi:hypothetical protein
MVLLLARALRNKNPLARRRGEAGKYFAHVHSGVPELGGTAGRDADILEQVPVINLARLA